MPLVCENEACGNEVEHTHRTTVVGRGKLDLCWTCSLYVRANKRLRTGKQVEQTNRLRRLRRNKGTRCFNPNCRTTKLHSGSYGRHNGQFYCQQCAQYANNHDGEERPKDLVDALKIPKGGGVCQNQNCGCTTTKLRVAKQEGKKPVLMCRPCQKYLAIHKRMRPVELVERRKETLKKQKNKAQHCFNANCRKKITFDGNYSKYNNQFYCRTCAVYCNRHHGKERTRELVLAHQRFNSKRMSRTQTCENPDCQRVVDTVIGATVDEKWMRLCRSCYNYWRKSNELRSAKMVKRVEEMKMNRKTKGNRCHNLNCRTADLVDGVWGKFDGEYYCRSCGRYANTHRGGQRPAKVVLAHAKPVRKCENPNCSIVTGNLQTSRLSGRGEMQLCPVCAKYVMRKHRLRSLETVQKAERTQRTRSPDTRCHNANCQTTKMTRGVYSKLNGEYYCGACCMYLDKHGEERPTKLVEREQLRKSRYMWMLNHPEK